MSIKPYGLICPITKACEMLEPRWTIPILTEMWSGSTRFNEIRRGVGNISPALLSKRLKELEALGLIEKIEDKASGTVDYFRTQKAIDLEPALDALAMWSQQYVEAEIATANLDVSTLMWKMRKYILSEELPDKRTVIRFHFSDEGLEYDTYWVLAHPEGTIEICSTIPDFDVDLYVETSSASLSALIMGRSTVDREISAERLFLSGNTRLARSMSRWLYVTTYISEKGVAMLSSGPVRASVGAA